MPVESIWIGRIMFVKFVRGTLTAGVSVAMLAAFSPQGMAATPSAADADGTPQLLTELQFGTATGTLASTALALSKLSPPGWSFSSLRGGSLTVTSTTSPTSPTGEGEALEGSYPVAGAGGQYVIADYNVASLRTEDIYIEFWAKMPGAKEGCKFVKVFGDKTKSEGNANTTISTNYTGGDYGAIDQVSFGDGTALRNDSQNVINLNGGYPQWIGRSYGTAKVSTPQMSPFSSQDWGTAWHHFRVHIKFNSGTTPQNEVPDGEYYLEIDGKVYVDAMGLYNRNPVNGPIWLVEFFGWAQKNPQGFQLWYDDIRISTGGFSSETLPEPPANVGVSLSGSG